MEFEVIKNKFEILFKAVDRLNFYILIRSKKENALVLHLFSAADGFRSSHR